MRKKPPFGWTLLIYAALFVLSELLRPKPKIEDQRPANLGDFNFPTATEGRVVPLIWGTVRLEGPNVLWYGDLRQEAITEKIKTGLFSSTTAIVGYKYRVGIQFGLCRGPIDSVLRLWIGDKIAYDSTPVTDGNVLSFDLPDFFGGDEGLGGVKASLRVFGGTETQLASSYLNSVRLTGGSVNSGGTGYAVDNVLTVAGGVFTTAATFRVSAVSSGVITGVELLDPGKYSVLPPTPNSVTGGGGSGASLALTFGTRFQSEAVSGQTPGYRGTCHLTPDTEPIYVGNSTQIKPWKFELRRIPNGLGLTGNHHIVNSADANPANVIYEYMTDTDWGLGFPSSNIDINNFKAAGDTLFTEGNGFSMLLDSKLEGQEFLRELERQISGVVFFNQLAGKWQINLARGGYDINLQPEITPDNRVELRNFSRGAWEDTTNIVQVEFNDRADSYKGTFALAQDLANVHLQAGVNVTASTRYPGVKNRTLANQLAWRDLRTLSFPLAKATVVVDRTFYAVQPGSVVAFTDSALGLTKLPMRVTRIGLGDLENGEITLDLVQDVFYFATPSFGDPINSGWAPPDDQLLPFIASEQRVIEAPRAVCFRDPVALGSVAPRLLCMGRRRGPEFSFRVRERHSAGTPSGAFADVGQVAGFVLIGRLKNTMAVGTATPTTSVVIEAVPDTQSLLEAAFRDGVGLADLGTNLVNIVLVGEEFMSCVSAQTSGSDVQLNSVYRALLDSVQASHSAGTPVWLLFAGTGLAETTLPETDNVDVKLLPRSLTDTVLESAATTIQLTMARRFRRPYPPSRLTLNGVEWDATSVSLEGTGSAAENFGILALLNRRDYRTAAGGDEVAALLTDAATLFGDFPTANTTTHEIDVRNDPAGANTLLFTVSGSSQSLTALRIAILLATDGVLPTTLRFVVRSKHVDGGLTLASRQEITFDFTVASALSGQFNFGALDTNDVSNLYTATVNGTYNFTLSSAFTAGAVEYRLNAGAWTTLIAAGNTTGSIAGVVATDTIEVRHTSTDTNALKQLDMNAPGAGQDGYAILFV